ncbi:MAG: FIST C-terminal domain-containing protein [Treponema sp.]|jgi:hypothetical protein|nr:FIST C-terminal domain-containing protein [Treponema sp.]
MIKVIVASTIEVSDLDFAVSEITGHIKKEGPLLGNTVGLLFCNFEFIQSGLVKKLGGCLPFDIVGCTSQTFAVQNAGEDFMLTLMVLTSDDVEFSAGLSGPLHQGDEASLETLYRDLMARGKDPSLDTGLILAFPPRLSAIPGNKVVDILDRVSGGVPIFGSVALDITTVQRSPMTIFNGDHYPDLLVMVLLRGNVQPRFFSHSLPGETHLNRKFTITKAEGNRIISIEGKPAVKYMEEMGLINRTTMDVFYAFPLVVDYDNGESSRAFVISQVDADDNSLISEQDIPQGGTANIGAINGDLVMASTCGLIDQVKKTAGSCNGLLLVSCFSRTLALQDPLEEINLVIKRMRDWPVPFVFFSSGGEIYPEPNKKGELVNNFHQFTIVACVL